MSLHLFGIRHHGPGSARSLRAALAELEPDIVLVEGPAEGEIVLDLAADPAMSPPVAMLIYRVDTPRRAAFYPFAHFSPEWIAIRYGLANNLPVRFFDLPQCYQLVDEVVREIDDDAASLDENISDENIPDTNIPNTNIPNTNTSSLLEQTALNRDPLYWLARAAGYNDGEEWWERTVEQRRDTIGIFEGIVEAMTSLREALPDTTNSEEALLESRREAWMRTAIRNATKQGYQKIAVVCGAWHTPALATMPTAKEDALLLKGLPKVKVTATWIPWSYNRLSRSSGYGAGIESPGWYHHLWDHPDDTGAQWMSRVAMLLRGEGFDVSSAHVIEGIRLAETLAAMRERTLPGLDEFNESVRSVFCFGDDGPLELIREKLTIGERLGEVPDATPMVPLQAELMREQKRLRLKPDPEQKVLDLDLRSDYDLSRSRLLHRLAILNVEWGRIEQVQGKKGTFHELWTLQWRPELAIPIVEAARWGNTIVDAASVAVEERAAEALKERSESPLPKLTRLIDRALLADLPNGIGRLISLFEAEAAVASDVGELMDALPPLANAQRYGNVRRTDAAMVAHVVNELVVRIWVGLPTASTSLDDEAAHLMLERIMNVNSAIALLQNEEHTTNWERTLLSLADREEIHGLLGGRCCRLLLDAHLLEREEGGRRMALALSYGVDPADGAAWIEGFLMGSGLLLLHDDILWDILDKWISTLDATTFESLLPLLRRTFSAFSPPERRQMGERARGNKKGATTIDTAFDIERGNRTLGIVKLIISNY